ncbi:ScbA/BarX family gamma-butyrolactone biosynthesis protein [Streptomyces sp. KMM 9044]|uniref:ScbA/BarX family gamma-butyrolactone biosynthesis protein n=1 Tax=Streptomyces sp. KMM 9044 TaxID=2744474 RepID=UPI0021511564|nr:ScbA/BarX family gamma-butyrolactone biosynthesis protein [Streptomyces sp. KMM 9044]WAX82212.1 ScbA/BarX family gamma-butyrolactone biosynthesis protein [Streptomyces sp. KMM 9044]
MSASTFRAERLTSSAPFSQDETATLAEKGLFRHPSLTTTVPKEFVHRASVAEVMLTDWQRRDSSHFAVAAQWPRGHSFFTAVQGCHDPLIAAETIRQAGVLLCHAELGVPLGHHFLMRNLNFSVHPGRLLVGSAPASIGLDVTFFDTKRHRGRLVAGRIEAVLRRDGHAVATGGASFTCASPAVYRRIRGRQRPDGGCPELPLAAPLPPQSVGRLLPMDVVLSPTEETGRWQLRTDIRHPVLFDHPVDHVPGMALIEAARQATTATLGRGSLPLSVETDFMRYVELDAPCFIEARRVSGGEPGREAVFVQGRQAEDVVFRSTVTVASSTA